MPSFSFRPSNETVMEFINFSEELHENHDLNEIKKIDSRCMKLEDTILLRNSLTKADVEEAKKLIGNLQLVFKENRLSSTYEAQFKMIEKSTAINEDLVLRIQIFLREIKIFYKKYECKVEKKLLFLARIDITDNFQPVPVQDMRVFKSISVMTKSMVVSLIEVTKVYQKIVEQVIPRDFNFNLLKIESLMKCEESSNNLMQLNELMNKLMLILKRNYFVEFRGEYKEKVNIILRILSNKKLSRSFGDVTKIAKKIRILESATKNVIPLFQKEAKKILNDFNYIDDNSKEMRRAIEDLLKNVVKSYRQFKSAFDEITSDIDLIWKN